MRRFIDLFAGIGGFHVALQKQGMECVFASEINKVASECYKANFNLAPHGDITQIAAEDIPRHDILCAGFPCQSFSVVGARKGFSDGRGQLFYEIIRIAKHHRPKVMLLENVPGVLFADGGQAIKIIYQEIEKLGYRLSHAVLNASHFNVPQSRDRVYFVAVLKESDLHFTPPLSLPQARVLKDILLPDHETANLVIKSKNIVIEKPEPQPYQLKPIRIGQVNNGGQGERIYSINGPAITQLANSGGAGHRTGLYWVNNKVRRLHITESKQVMGFDKEHIVSEGIEGYRQLGNAVIPAMITEVYGCVRIRG